MSEKFQEGGNEIVIKPDKRTKIDDTTLYPYCCIGMVNIFFGGKPYYGTGILISGRIVLSCAHNIYNRDMKKQA